MVFVIAISVPVLGLSQKTVIESTRTIKVVGDKDFPPFEYISNSGSYTGFNIDILNAISIETGLKLEFYPMPWNEAIEALKKGEVDAIQGMKYSESRDQIFNFSEPYLTSSQGIFVLKENLYIFDINDLDGRKIALQSGDFANDLLSKLERSQFFATESYEEAIDLLINGEVDAFVGNRITGQYLVQKKEKQQLIKIVGEPIEPTNYGVAVLPNNDDLLEMINKGIGQLKRNGTYDKINKKWFGEFILPSTRNLEVVLMYFQIGFSLVVLTTFLVLWWNRLLKKEVEKRTKEITAMNKKLEQEDRLRSLGQLTLGIAHEIRNPLMTLLTYTKLLPKKFNNPEFRTFFIDHVSLEITRLNHLVSHLLEYARPKKPQPASFSIYQLVETLLQFFELRLREKNLNVENLIDPSIIVYADMDQIKQVLMNIIINSIEATEKEGSIVFKVENENPSEITLSIEDSGYGLDHKELHKVFEPFYTSKTSGTGLGLSICYQLMKENQGNIDIRSIKGEGTTLILQLPKGEGTELVQSSSY